MRSESPCRRCLPDLTVISLHQEDLSSLSQSRVWEIPCPKLEPLQRANRSAGVGEDLMRDLMSSSGSVNAAEPW